ncbi:hypothetical protein MPSEU_000104900 [Mayamaea pseudoterrestris]|nr:hypothetical protein MPSEU_000104900 [Mayamaea pseudoterrestris]
MANVTVIGIGAMGGGMARALLDSSVCKTVTGFDQSASLVRAFHQDSQAAKKSLGTEQPTSLRDAVTADTDVVVLVLQTEAQCDLVCFGGTTEDDGEVTSPSDCLLSLLTSNHTSNTKHSCVILCSTVTPSWTKVAAQKFRKHEIHFVDSPMSGGPVRARAGDLTMMASGSQDCLDVAMPILLALGGKEENVHIIAGGPGMGSTVKAVHQLLAGVHIVVAAEALSLAAAAGLDVEQVYRIVNGAAGSSWMFRDRGHRMINNEDVVKSQLRIFVKDLDIVYNEAKRLNAPIPLASAALQQFIAGVGLGLGTDDDSKLVRVYENVTGVPVRGDGIQPQTEGNGVGDFWKMEDGTLEEIVEVGLEPRHKAVISNEYVRALRVEFPANDTTLAHQHAEDSLYFFLVDGLTVVNHVKGQCPMCDAMEFGEVRFGAHKSEHPLVHKITNKSDKVMFCIDAEILEQPPVTSITGLVADKHELIKTREKCRVYKLTLEPGESVNVTYPFFHLTVILEPSTIQKELAGPLQWNEETTLGDVAWREPIANMTKTNVGTTRYVEYIAEWR